MSVILASESGAVVVFQISVRHGLNEQFDRKKNLPLAADPNVKKKTRWKSNRTP